MGQVSTLSSRLRMHPTLLVISDEERRTLLRATRLPTSTQRLAFRARIVLTRAAGTSVRATARRLGCCPRTVRKWSSRMAAQRILGLRDAARPGRPRRITASERCTVIAVACTPPEQSGLAGYTNWSGSLLAEALRDSGRVGAISARSVQRILHLASLKPHRCDYWKRRTDPHFDVKMRPIIDLYLDPPTDGPVWSIDEKTSIQALQRRHPELPMRRPGELIKREAEYRRHGTRCLTAGLEVHTGKVLGLVTPRRPAAVFTSFLDRLHAQVPAGQVIHAVVDNLNTHRGPAVATWQAAHPGRLQLHFLPFYASWLNQIEMWFRTLVRRLLRHGDFHSLANLEAQLYAFIATYNRLHAHPYRWTYTGDPLAA
jgi:transposase